MSAVTIARETIDERHGRYVGRIAGKDGEAELTFTWRGEKLLSADHSGTPEPLRGLGLARALVERLVADARAEAFRIIPLCPCVRHKYEEHPEWRDVMTVAPGELPHLTIR